MMGIDNLCITVCVCVCVLCHVLQYTHVTALTDLAACPGKQGHVSAHDAQTSLQIHYCTL